MTTISDYERSILANSALMSRLEAAAADIDRGATTPVSRRPRKTRSEA
ncbi:hypothetical protein [Agrococcus sp. KRD186]|nr:hypothetical protein [Agrococcus sp. KRD186]